MADRINVCLVVVVVGATLLSGALARSSGAPSEACSDMRPQHLQTEPSLLPPPFTVTVSSTQFTAQHPVRGQHSRSLVQSIFCQRYARKTIYTVFIPSDLDL